jgi:hypothetical protein
MNATGLILAVIAISIVLAAGCGAAQVRDEPLFGEVISHQPGVTGYMAAQVVKVNVDGQEQPLSRLFSNATLLVFLDKPCGTAQTRVMKASSRVNYDVTVIAVSSSPDQCAAEKSCVFGYGQAVGRLISLCDSENVLRNVYSVGPDGGVLLLDDVGFIISHGTLNQFDELRMRSQGVARDAQVDADDLIRGGGASSLSH